MPKIDPSIPEELRQAVITRTFDAPRELVWQAWTDPQHIRQWWGPHGFDAPHPSVDLRVGGKINFDMRAPDGSILPVSATIREIKPPERLVLAQEAMFGNDPAEMLNEIGLTEEKGGKTKLTLRVIVVQGSAAMLEGLKGMRQGWGEALDKMAQHLDLRQWIGEAAAGNTSFTVPGDQPLIVVRRTFDAPRDLVWQALTDPKLRAEWWGPARQRVKIHEFDVRPGGKLRIDQVDQDGKTVTFSGEFTEVRGPQRLVSTFRCEPLPAVRETITLSEENGQTTLTTITRLLTVLHRDAWVANGREQGARESMERLAALLSGLKLAGRAHDLHMDTMAKKKVGERKVTHAMFTIDRTFDAAPSLVFGAFADQKAKDRWFGGPPGWLQGEKSMDFRVGGRDVNIGGPVGGPMSKFYSTYYDIVPNERIVYVYEMYLDDLRISVSVATIEFRQNGKGTQLKLTEQGALLDGFDNPAAREEGTRYLMEALARSLGERSAAS